MSRGQHISVSAKSRPRRTRSLAGGVEADIREGMEIAKTFCLSLSSVGSSSHTSQLVATRVAGCVLLLTLGVIGGGWQRVAGPSNQKPLSFCLSPVWVDGVGFCSLRVERGRFVSCRKLHWVIPFFLFLFPGARQEVEAFRPWQALILWRCCFLGRKVL